MQAEVLLLPSPTKEEQQEQLLRLLASSDCSVEHYRFLGNWLYLLIQVHRTVLALCYTPFPPLLLCTGMPTPRLCIAGVGSSSARRKGHRHASRGGREPDSAPHLLPRDGARPRGPQYSQQRACIRPPARLRVYRSFWIKSRRRKKCLILHTPPATTTDPTHPTLAQSQLTVLRHVPTRA